MVSITLCTFNVENLFGRYKVFGYLPSSQFKKEILTPEELKKGGGFLPGEMYVSKDSFQIFDKDQWRFLTAKALKGNTKNYPDIACLQEIESLRVLRKFNHDYLGKIYPYLVLIDSHDPRLIDIGVLSKHKIIDIGTHIDEPYKDRSGYLFSRDCLEITFDVRGRPLTLFVNHLKSKYAKEGTQKRDADMKRKNQAKMVAELLKKGLREIIFSRRLLLLSGILTIPPIPNF